MSSPINLFILYSILKKLVTPFNKTKAYKLGIIDAEGNILKRRSTLTTVDERKAYTLFDTFIFNMKKLLEKVPGGKSRLASFLAAGFLLKEHEENHEYLSTGFIQEWINKNAKNFLVEDAPVNSTGTGIAGMELPLKYRPVKKSKFCGKVVFDVDSDTYNKNIKGRPKWSRYSKFVGSDRIGKSIQKYMKDYPKNSIILRDVQTKQMMYFKY